MDRSAATRELRILMLEDTPSDAELVEHELRKSGLVFSARRVETHAAFVAALEEFRPDIVLSDYRLPDFDGMAAVQLVRSSHPEIPVVMVTGVLSDLQAVELLHAGAKDYVLKDTLTRLPSAVQRALSAEQGVRARKAAEQALRESEAKFRALVESTDDWIWEIDAGGVYTYSSPQACNLLGYTPEEVVGKTPFDLMPPDEAARLKAVFAGFASAGKPFRLLENIGRHKDGRLVYLETSGTPIFDERGIFRGYRGIDRDITERKLAEQSVRAARDLLSSIIENIPIRIFWKDADLRYLGCNTVFARDAGMAHPEDLLGKDDFQMAWREQAELYRADDRRVMDSGNPKLGYEEPQTTPDGRTIWLRTSKVPLHDTDGKVLGMLGIYDDITERKQAEQEREQYFKFFNASSDLMGIADPNGAFKKVNPTFISTLGYSEAEILAKPFIEFVHPDDRQQTLDEMARQLQRGYSFNFENRYVCKDGSVRWLSWRAKVNAAEGLTYATARDITENKATEVELLRLNRVLRTLSEGNRTMLHATEESELMHNMCEVIVSNVGYVLAWIGLARQDKSIEAVAVTGAGRDYVEALRLSWDDVPAGRGPTGIAVRTGQTQIAHDIPNNPNMTMWREAATRHGFASSIALPLKAHGDTFGALTIYASETDAFNAGEVALLEEVANDLAFGITTLRTRNERNQAMQERQHFADQLRASLEDALQAMAATVEMRDPYTAGHQRRVAHLATAIARQMGLPEEQVHGIRLAGIVHDLGKIHVPAEILSKPGRLNEIEFSLIKLHPQAGYEILKGIDFPWPIAQAVLQHHERLDGSGYPQGLTRDAILLEARVLAVADTVEAMASHRPYRPGLGLEAALAEISANRGTLYDPAVVDACLELFNRQGYMLPA